MENEEPVWTKPCAKIRIKKPSSKPRPVQLVKNGERLNSSLPILPTQDRKRRNPFSKGEDADTARPEENKKLKLSASPNLSSPFSTNSAFSRVNNVQPVHPPDRQVSEAGACESAQQLVDDIPIDWSLKTRVRFNSPQSWSWGSHQSTVEAASGITGGVRCLDIGEGNHCLDTSPSSQFHSNCLYWQHPALPGATLFPRYSQSSIAKGERLAMSPEMERSMHSDWMDSLQSVYQLVKARQCPYFYVCSPSFTCLFRSAGICGAQQLIALLTPTTSGIRTALKREDVEFTMPLHRTGSRGEEAGDREDDEGEEANLGGGKASCSSSTGGMMEEETSEFLESLGIEANSLPGLNNTNPKNRAQLGVTIDGKGESLVFVEGVECQSLLNYLLNAKLTQGVGGLPPTILAPVAFCGATLRSLKVKESVVGGKGGLPKSYQIDLQGPILPHALLSLARLSSCHSPRYSASIHTQEDTASFSLFSLPTQSVAPSAFGTAGLNDCGLIQPSLETFCRVRPSTVLRDILCRNKQFGLNTQQEDQLRRS